MSQRLFAFSYGWSPQQLKRIEAGEVAPRFGPTWHLCFMGQVNPLWLAFGEPSSRYGCWPFPVYEKHPELTPEMPFIEVMRDIGAEYKIGDKLEGGTRSRSVKRPGIFVFRSNLAELTAKFAERIPKADQAKFSAYLAVCADRFVARKAISDNAIDMAVNIHDTWMFTVSSNKNYWQKLRKRVVEATVVRGARAALARRLGVTPQTLNEWIQGRNAPPAEQTLRLLRWVGGTERLPKQKSAPEVRSTRPALKTRKSKSTKHEKAKSDQKKH